MAYRKIEEATEKWQEEGKVIEGVLVRVEDNVGPNKSIMYTIKQADGSLVKAWGATILDSLMGAIEVGSQVKITFTGLGKKTGGKAAAKLFIVEVDDERKTAVDHEPAGGANDSAPGPQDGDMGDDTGV